MKIIKSSLTIYVLFAIFAIVKPQKVQAKTFSSYQTKIINNKNYGVYTNLTKNGPRGWRVNTQTLRYANYQASQMRRIGKTNYWYVLIDGHLAGWVNENAFAKNKISVAKNISLVYNPEYSFPTRDAINYATDAQGTSIDVKKVHVSKNSIDSAKVGKHKIKFTYGKGHASATVIVRSNKKEGIKKGKAKPQSGGTTKTWLHHYKTSGNWGKGASYAPETKPHTLRSKGLNLKTVFYQPATLSQGATPTGAMGPTPEGMVMSNGVMYASMYLHPYLERARIVSYKMNAIPDKYVMQKLPWIEWNQFVNLAKDIKISPYIKLGHGQTLSASKNYLYVIANDHNLKNSPQSEEIMQISKKDLQIKKIWTFKIWNGSKNKPKYIHNATFVSDKKFYAVQHNGTEHQFEYWEVTRHGNEWHPKQIGITKGEFMKNGSPVQGFTYDSKKKEFYLAFNDCIMRIAKNGKLLSTHHYNTGREIEGVSAVGNTLYVELAERPELMSGKIS
ncbi:SH3-like domain-containing protein [Lactobacillus sp. LL6]|uniref:SH3-like domain-containing protein n=1 Tax=Lactobacillus sp. LL6 TaxID=2596827 RepID=UPI00118558C9|nr:SH3-like domain-containing protein [Lactobacillus sp. LL6]TSO26040.1 hypothetical protein FOD82_02915 [Lactobacillus sp. LL6]